MNNEVRLQDRWIWNWEVARVWIIIPVSISIILILVLYPFWGPMSLLCLLFLLQSLTVYVTHKVITKKLAKLKFSIADEEGEISESRLVIGAIQSPGLAVIKSSGLKLLPVVGKPVNIKFDDIMSVHKTTFLYGKKLFWKQGFVLKVKDKKRIGFAVPEFISHLWEKTLNDSITKGNT